LAVQEKIKIGGKKFWWFKVNLILAGRNFKQNDKIFNISQFGGTTKTKVSTSTLNNLNGVYSNKSVRGGVCYNIIFTIFHLNMAGIGIVG